MKRFIVFSLLLACSEPSQPSSKPCQPLTCQDFNHSLPPFCGQVYDGCGKDLDCGPCDLSDLGGDFNMGFSNSTTNSGSSSTGSSDNSSGIGGANMCEDLVFEK